MNLAKIIVTVVFAFSTISHAQTTAPATGCVAVGCSNRGICNATSGVCVCDQGYLTPNSPPGFTYNGPGCSYEQKSQRTATLIHGIFLGLFGGGNFYAGQYASASGQLILGMSSLLILMGGCGSQGCVILDCSPCQTNRQNQIFAYVLFGVSMAIAAADIIWWGIDLARFVRNEIPDQNGYPLTP